MSTAPPPRRPRGRPPGGGNTAEQARTILLDAAERSILLRGYQTSTMETIAHEAGYSRAAMCRLFPNRRSLLEALVRRAAGRYQLQITERLPAGASLAELLVESLVIVATVPIHDPLLRTIAEQTEDGTVGQLIADDPALPELVEAMLAGHGTGIIRPGLQARDVGQYIVSTALAMLTGVVPGADDPDTARRYLQTFFLPALLIAPPGAAPVFDQPRDEVRYKEA